MSNEAAKRDREAYHKMLNRRSNELEEEFYEKWDYKVSEADRYGWQDESDRQEWEKFSAEVDKPGRAQRR